MLHQNLVTPPKILYVQTTIFFLNGKPLKRMTKEWQWLFSCTTKHLEEPTMEIGIDIQILSIIISFLSPFYSSEPNSPKCVKSETIIEMENTRRRI